MVTKVPVLPPAFRPVSVMQTTGNQLVSDSNYLYKELFDANENLKNLHGVVDDVSEERKNVYNAFKGVTGLGDPIQPKNQERQVKGLLKQVFGGAPKYGMVQRQLLGSAVDLVGRAVVIPNPDLDMDQIGIPENKAWDVYKPFIIRSLVLKGVPRLEAARHVNDKSPMARDALLAAMEDRPVVASRAPVLHKYGVMAFWPKLVKGDVLQTSPLINKGFNLDHDGDEVLANIWLAIPSETYHNIPEVERTHFWELRRMSAHFQTALHYKAGFEFFAVNLEDFPHDPEFSQKEHIKFHPVKEKLFVVSYDEKTNRPILAEVSSWSEHLDREIVLINLKSGRQMISDDDPRAVYALDPLDYTFKRFRPAGAIGKFVPRIDKLPADLCENDFPAIPLRLYMHDRDSKLRDELEINRRSGYLLGALVGDGWVSAAKGQYIGVCLSCINPGVDAAFENSLVEILRDPPRIIRQESFTSHGKSIKLTVSRVEFAEFIEPLIGHRAKNKHLPPFYLSANKEFRLGLLAGLIDTDGSIAFSNAKSKPQLMANFSSVSIRLVQEVQHLLRSLGVRSRITPSKTPAGEPYWMLMISAMDLQNIDLKVYHTEKKRILESAAKIDETTGPANKNNIVPISSELAGLFMRAVDRKAYPSLYVSCSKAKTTNSISRASAKKLLNLCGDAVTHEHLAVFSRIVANKETSWDQVESFDVTDIKETGYDLTVPDSETFMSVDGVILSNTMNYHVPVSEGAKQDAIEKMLPSRNLFSTADFQVHQLPGQEFVGGLYEASTARNEKHRPHTFATKKDAIRAYRENRIDIDTPVEIVQH